MTLEKHTKFTYWYVPYFYGNIFFRTEEGAKRYFLREDAEKPNGVTFYWGIPGCEGYEEYSYEDVKAMSLEKIREEGIKSVINDYDNCTCIPISAPCRATFEMDFED